MWLAQMAGALEPVVSPHPLSHAAGAVARGLGFAQNILIEFGLDFPVADPPMASAIIVATTVINRMSL